MRQQGRSATWRTGSWFARLAVVRWRASFSEREGESVGVSHRIGPPLFTFFWGSGQFLEGIFAEARQAWDTDVFLEQAWIVWCYVGLGSTSPCNGR